MPSAASKLDGLETCYTALESTMGQIGRANWTGQTGYRSTCVRSIKF